MAGGRKIEKAVEVVNQAGTKWTVCSGRNRKAGNGRRGRASEVHVTRGYSIQAGLRPGKSEGLCTTSGCWQKQRDARKNEYGYRTGRADESRAAEKKECGSMSNKDVVVAPCTGVRCLQPWYSPQSLL